MVDPESHINDPTGPTDSTSDVKAALPGDPAASDVKPSPPILEYGRSPDDPAYAVARRWVHVWTAQNTFDANLVVNALDAENIPARVDMENSAALGNWGLSGPGGTQVQVPAAVADDARRILEEIESKRAERLAMNQTRCPKCAHAPAHSTLHPFRKQAAFWLVMTVLLLILGNALGLGQPAFALAAATGMLGIILLLVTVTPRWTCPKCGHHWAISPPEVDEDDD